MVKTCAGIFHDSRTRFTQAFLSLLRNIALIKALRTSVLDIPGLSLPCFPNWLHNHSVPQLADTFGRHLQSTYSVFKDKYPRRVSLPARLGQVPNSPMSYPFYGGQLAMENGTSVLVCFSPARGVINPATSMPLIPVRFVTTSFPESWGRIPKNNPQNLSK